MTTRTTGLPPTPVRRTWPLSLGLTVLAVILVAVDLFGGAIVTAPFFGEIPSRSDHLQAGATAVSAAAPLAVLVLAGWVLGSRIGLVGIVVPAILSVGFGVAQLSLLGGPSDPDRDRAMTGADVVTGLNTLNGVALVLALLLLLVLVVVRRRRRAGAAALGSSSTPAS